MFATRKLAAKYGPRIAAVAAAPLTLVGTAQAAIPADVSTALGSLSTDALQVAGIVLAAIIAVFAFKFIRKGL